jgi:lactate 2-monooxygenase
MTVPVIFDSRRAQGRRGDHACARRASSGHRRPYAYGLAVDGQAGIEHVLRGTHAELHLIMAADGYPSVIEFHRGALRWAR